MDNLDNTPDQDVMKKKLASMRLLSTDSANMGTNCVKDLGVLFDAIIDASEEHSKAHRLANIGSYLADDWSVMIDNMTPDNKKNH